MTENFFDHDRLDVYRLSIEYVADAFDISRSLEGLHRHARDQWLRAAQSIPLNIAEGNGKRSLKDRARFLDIARGSALECAAIQDVLVVSGGLSGETDHKLKSRLVRIVAMLTSDCDDSMLLLIMVMVRMMRIRMMITMVASGYTYVTLARNVCQNRTNYMMIIDVA